ncbi:hypothetical protein COY28_04270 [Candidatus Woesearchaeota archaeon CG_4_10_14_0_2_um_filter_57_5]|nr:MAG: hypothetical protein AUJ68_05805 [Candidatus Woesearchaeota archaeon CG1_02_57_44]PIN70260.1 MAG: hypothetical protein COV94_01920 [Candidatus Woesearchaeota archaeon CG11_big_fil_rev_8_21_14_0_20_57_5]PIZ52771.1 MAG: hypothetical protein COY28_04270 [Candidatus Woesearchaeota archaeon CG_4_10_14_0_2_um_filter_57_5]
MTDYLATDYLAQLMQHAGNEYPVRLHFYEQPLPTDLQAILQRAQQGGSHVGECTFRHEGALTDAIDAVVTLSSAGGQQFARLAAFTTRGSDVCHAVIRFPEGAIDLASSFVQPGFLEQYLTQTSPGLDAYDQPRAGQKNALDANCLKAKPASGIGSRLDRHA